MIYGYRAGPVNFAEFIAKDAGKSLVFEDNLNQDVRVPIEHAEALRDALKNTAKSMSGL